MVLLIRMYYCYILEHVLVLQQVEHNQCLVTAPLILPKLLGNLRSHCPASVVVQHSNIPPSPPVSVTLLILIVSKRWPTDFQYSSILDTWTEQGGAYVACPHDLSTLSKLMSSWTQCRYLWKQTI